MSFEVIERSKMLFFNGHYQYAICIDMVTTCWDKKNYSQADEVDRQEIIGINILLLLALHSILHIFISI